MTLLQMMRSLLALNVRERNGDRDHPAIVWAHELCRMGEGVDDEVAWCSSIINLAAALAGRKRSLSAAARSWINTKIGVVFTDRLSFGGVLRTMVGNEDVVLVFKRGAGRGQSGADVLDAPGHVAVFVNYIETQPHAVQVIGGNQSNQMTETWMPVEDLIAIVVIDQVKKQT
jgi:hypothetical protein